jgi:hypothetical protein
MKLIKALAIMAIAVSLITVANAEDKKAETKGTPGKCCAKAAKEGKKCEHACCVEAAKAGKNCEKCGGKN